jgi:aryl-alcohol dehydrogenase-like predicted oxidoreductase
VVIRIDRRPLGRTGLLVSSLGMGCARLGAIWQGRSERDAREALSLGLSAGINFFDTSDVYGRGQSERILGSVVRGVRDEVVVATKCGLIRTPSTFLNASASVWGRSGRGRRLSSLNGLLKTRRRYAPEYIARAGISSLRRLKTDRLDLFLLHSPPRDVLLDEEVIDTMARLRQEGTIRFWGISARNDDEALIALGMRGIDCLEIELSVCHPRPSADVIPQAASRGIAVIARQPFASGRLVTQPPPLGMTLETVVAGCLQFATGVPGVATVVAGMSQPKHVARNVAAMKTSISEAELQEIRLRCPEI